MNMVLSKVARMLTAIGMAVSAPMVQADVLCADSFSEIVTCDWGNEVGSWTIASGTYGASVVSSAPLAQSSLPFALTDFTVQVDVVDIQDGGLWLRSSPLESTRTGRVGVLLVTGGLGGVGTGLYWHVVEPDTVALPTLVPVSGLFTPGVSDARLRVQVVGDTYSVFLDGAAAPVTTLVTDAFSSGEVALYDNSVQTFDNFVLTAVPEPSSLWLWAGGLVVLGVGARRR